MVSLETEFAGIRFPNPFIIGAGPATASGEKVIRAFRAGWGGVVLKTFGLEPTRNVSPRIQLIRSGKDPIGMFDIELFSDHTLDWWETQIQMIRDAYPDRPVIASVAGGGSVSSWQEPVRRVESLGVSAFELNVSCPSFDKEKGCKLGQDPASLSKAIRWVREAAHLPLIVKLTPNVTDIVALARVALEAGADAFTTSNSLTGIAGIDLDTFEPQPAVGGTGIIGGYGGVGLKPVSLRCTASIAQAFNGPAFSAPALDAPQGYGAHGGPLVPILGLGGIARWQDAAEYLAVGASAVQVCTAVMIEGFDLIASLTGGLSRYLLHKGFSSPAALVGRALPHLGVFPDLDLNRRMVAQVDPALCRGCETCVRACDTGGYQAIAIHDHRAVVDPALCDGCGLCASLCLKGAIQMLSKN